MWYRGAKIEGGHCVNIVGYDDPNSLLFIVSWGQAIGMTYNFFKTYAEEAWTLYSTDWVQQNGVDMSQFDHARVLAS